MRDPHPPRAERERHYRRVIGVGLAVSLLVHVVVVLFLSRQLALPAMHYAPIPRQAPSFEGIRALQLQAPPAVSGPSGQPARPESPEGPETGASPRTSENRGAVRVEKGERLTNGEKLQPRPGDLRVWQGIRAAELPPRTLAELARADSAVRAILGSYLDSLALSAEARKRASEWLIHKGDKSWGIAPDGLHLGKIVIPIPFGQLFQPYGDKARELEQQVRDLEIIRFQDALQEARKVQQEREKEMVKRARDEAGKASADSGGSPRDTTGGGGR
ncbi:MAG: hypothetical protein Q8W51_12175 [Candidatus Palauibacterales bacterium]|nr:hypothetical protein [Candidatus Palauibacterales bacterium]MDP2582965.1 hypothetical protein [Candidatus Palauibacterales bacterium]